MQLHERLEAISASRVDGPSKLVLIMLAKRLDRDDPDGLIWSSSETLAEECGVSTKAITRTMERLTKAGIIRIVSKAAQGRSARKAIDWTALAAAERDTSAIENIPAEKRRRVGSRSDEPSDLEATDSRTLGRRTVDSRSDAASEDPIIDPSMNPIPESDPGTRPAREATVGPLSEDQPTESHTMPPDDRQQKIDATLTTLTTRWAGVLARLAEGPTGAHNIGAPYLTGSSPTKTDDPIDNGGDKAHPPEASAPSLPIDEGDASTLSAASATTPATAPPAQDPWGVAPCGEPAQASAYIWLDEPQPAPKRTPKSKPKAKGKTDDAAILAIAAQVDRMKGRTGVALPGSGRWKMLVSAVSEAGADRVLARVTAMADAAQGLPSPAQAVFAQMSGSDWGTDPILRGNNGWTVKLDDAIEASQSRSDASQAVGGVVGRLDPQNRSQGQMAPKQNGSSAWDDMLSVIRGTGGLRLSLGLRGSTLSHDADEHKRRCQAVADIGGWAKLCELNDFNRATIRAQFVAAYDRAGVVA